jgi:hypothetical protein
VNTFRRELDSIMSDPEGHTVYRLHAVKGSSNGEYHGYVFLISSELVRLSSHILMILLFHPVS